MDTATRTQRTYDHRLKDLVHETGDVDLALRHGVPRSTARDWTRQVAAEVVSVDVFSMSEETLQREILALRRRNAKLVAVLRLAFALLRVLDVTLANRRVSGGAKKRRLLEAVERSREILSLRGSLRILGLSSSRYHSWKRVEDRELDDASSCPRTFPQQLTSEEVGIVKDMATSEEYRHVPTGTLAVLAARLGKVFASAATWHRLVRRHRWRRPRRRVHPTKPKIGIRASVPNQIWHVDTTVVRLLDGTKAYLHAVIDNFSRRILAWRVAERLDPANTVAILVEATRGDSSADPRPTLLADAGVENVNAGVDELIDSGFLTRVLAQTEIAYSNSMIESWWRSLKNQWLYLNTLDTVASVRRLTSFYVSEHNTQLPHSAFEGQTPDEMYFGRGDHVPDELERERRAARKTRLERNRAVSCRTCRRAANAS